MQVSVENVGKLERKVTVRIPADSYESQVKTRMAEVGKTVRLKGFRPGKVPPKVVEQRFGAQIRGEAMNELVRTSFQQAVDQQKLRPAFSPQISTSGEPVDGEIEYTATFEVLPEMDKLDVTTLAVTKAESAVEESDVDTMIETLRQQRRSWSAVERGAQTGDMVLFEIVEKDKDDAARERAGTIIGSAAVTKELEDKLVGHSAGDEFDVDMPFPSDFRISALAGRQANVAMKIVRVQEAKLPEIDDTFVASFGIGEGGLEKFRADVRANLERELKNVLAARLKNEVVQKLVDSHPDIDVPETMCRRRSVRPRAASADPGPAAGTTDPAPGCRDIPRSGPPPRHRRVTGRRIGPPEWRSRRQPPRRGGIGFHRLHIRRTGAGG